MVCSNTNSSATNTNTSAGVVLSFEVFLDTKTGSSCAISVTFSFSNYFGISLKLQIEFTL